MYALLYISIDECKELIQKADIDGNRNRNYEEFNSVLLGRQSCCNTIQKQSAPQSARSFSKSSVPSGIQRNKATGQRSSISSFVVKSLVSVGVFCVSIHLMFLYTKT